MANPLFPSPTTHTTQTPESFISDLRTRTKDMTPEERDRTYYNAVQQLAQERGFPQAQLNNLINTHITRR